MNRIVLAIATILTALLGVASVNAHPGHEHAPDMRIWKDADGLFEIEASFVLARDDRVQLHKHDGSMIWIPLAKLSPADRTWVRERVEAIRRLNGMDGDSRPAPTSASDSAPRQSEASSWPVAVAVFGLALLAAVGQFVRRNLVLVPAVGGLLVLGSLGLTVAQEKKAESPAIQKHFEPFKHRLTFRFDDDFFYVGSSGFPEHPMLGGIKAWNQQVPLPQPYTGNNAFRIPLRPRLADKPISGNESFFKGAIAVAVNGVPIFNPIKQNGKTDTFLAGELDEFGGHCGRADDYHYHIAPIHLQKTIGEKQPLAYALDGFPLMGYTDADGKEPKDLDAFNGRTDKDGKYRYYATKIYPYVNGGLRGVVDIKDGEVAVQPRAAPVRPFLPGLKGAVKIEPVTLDGGKGPFTVKYEYQGQTRTIRYLINPNGTYTFTFIDEKGKEQTEIYTRKEGKGGKKGEKGPPQKDDGKKKDKKKDDKEPRMPWLAAHFDELDTNKDGFLTAEELKAEVDRVFKLFDKNSDGKLTKDEYDVARPDVKSPLAGFVRGHAEEIDANGDGVITREETQAVMTRMFDKADRKRTGKISREDASGK